MARIQHKRGTSANLASVNPTPLAGELVWDSTENAIKIGDGATAWTSLAYVTATPRSHNHDDRYYTETEVDTLLAGKVDTSDSRLSDARTPTAHKATHATGGSDALTPADIGAAPAASPAITGNATFEASSGVPVTITNTGTGNSFVVNDASGDTTPFVVDASGRVGIGRTPSVSGTSLEVAGDIFVAPSKSLAFYHTNGTAGIGTPSGAGLQFWAKGDASDAIRFQGRNADGSFNGTDLLRITTGGASLGNIGIGTNSPVSRLDVNGVITVSATSGSAGSYLPSVTISGDANTGFGQVSGQSDTASVFTAGHERVRVKSTGAVRFVPLTADPGTADAGDVYYNSSTNKLRVYDGTSWVDLH